MARPEKNQKKMYYGKKVRNALENVGNQMRLARLRRKLSVELIAERVGVSRTTIWKVEKGDPSVAMGIYAKTLAALQLLGDIELLAKEE